MWLAVVTANGKSSNGKSSISFIWVQSARHKHLDAACDRRQLEMSGGVLSPYERYLPVAVCGTARQMNQRSRTIPV